MNFADLVKQKEILLDEKSLRDGDLDVLTKVLQKSKVLKYLGLWNHQITLSDDKFTDALAHNRTLRILNLGCNKIGVEGAKRLAAALKVNQTLQKIHLDGNQIGDEGAKCFADALMVNKSLQMMSLTGNNIGDEGAESLATSFVVNQSLRRISLDANRFGDTGAEKLVNALKCNFVINELDLLSIHISAHVRRKIRAILDDPNRKVPNNEQKSSLNQLEMFLAKKDEEIAAKDEEIASKNTDIAAKDEKIDSLKADLESPIKHLEKFIASKEAEITSLKYNLENSKPIIDTVDLTSDKDGRTNKRRRLEIAAKSNLAILHEQNQKTVRVKQEKDAAETALKSVREEKEAVEADLEEVRDDLGDANDLVQQQYLAQDIWQRRFDELASLVRAGQVDGAMISDIRNRSLASGL